MGSRPLFFSKGVVGMMDVEVLVTPVIEGAGFELVEVTFGRESGTRVLRITVDRPGSALDLDTIAELAEKVSRRLDLEGFAPGPYRLEVSSPGIERPLKRREEFERFLGAQVKVKSHGLIDNVRNHSGELVSADAEAIVIATDGGERRVGYPEIASARTVADWDAELKRSSA
ncbi:MAG: ribosome maturation factor RimP [Actinomycetota bacterium]|nr:ribosome maturation factor RimP [Actinomycetota bacterium]